MLKLHFYLKFGCTRKRKTKNKYYKNIFEEIYNSEEQDTQVFNKVEKTGTAVEIWKKNSE